MVSEETHLDRFRSHRTRAARPIARTPRGRCHTRGSRLMDSARFSPGPGLGGRAGYRDMAALPTVIANPAREQRANRGATVADASDRRALRRPASHARNRYRARDALLHRTGDVGPAHWARSTPMDR